jgi:hypothetical protein
MRFFKFRHMRGRARSPIRATAAAIEALETRALLSGSITALQTGLLEGRRGFVGSVNARTKPADYRSFTLEAPASLSAVLDHLTANANLTLIHDANHNGRIDSGEVLANSAHTGTSAQVISKSLAAGTYIVAVAATSAAGASYHLSLTSDYAGNTPKTARNIGTLAASATFHDFVGPSDPSDYYRVALTSARTLSAGISHLSASAALQIIADKNADGIIQSSEVLASAAGASGATVSRVLSAGTYFVRVLGRGTDTNYQLSLTSAAAPATNGLHILFDYRYDTGGFFASHPDAKAALQQAAVAFSRFTDHLSAITPNSGNSWSETFIDPTTGKQDTLANPCVAANTVVIYVGASTSLQSLELGEGAPGGWSATGSTTWLDTVEARSQLHALDARPTDFGPWGGSISFSAVTKWNFSTKPPQPGQNDFLSVALHEIAHVLGFGTAPSWFTYVQGHDFIGPHTEKALGGPAPLFDSNDHWATDTFSTANGTPQLAIMVPALPVGQRRAVTALDYAALEDIGWQV